MPVPDTWSWAVSLVMFRCERDRTRPELHTRATQQPKVEALMPDAVLRGGLLSFQLTQITHLHGDQDE